MKKIFLYPASLYAEPEPAQVVTILGSCVAVCLWDPVLQIGGINHFMLPLWNGQGLASPRYGNIAIEKLLSRLEYLGSKRGDIKAKIFGGGEVIESGTNQFQIGKRNIAVAREYLSEFNIPIVSSSVGGKLGRKILFYTETGEVRQRYIGTEK
jgi:chemotaxis protein CheD